MTHLSGWSARLAVTAVLAVAAGACDRAADPAASPTVSPSRSVATTITTTSIPTTTTSTTAVVVTPGPPATAPRSSTTAAPAARPRVTTTTSPPSPITIRYRVERRTTDEATADFEAVVEATLGDGRGWERASFVFERAGPGEDAPYLVVLAEGDEVDRLCLPYDTYGRYSCQNGPTVALNADRWRAATPKWTGDLPDYRRMLVNHEVGHLLGMKHPRPQCPARGRPAPVMNQQSTELDGCLPNPWPLDDEIAVAARHDRKLAPGPGE